MRYLPTGARIKEHIPEAEIVRFPTSDGLTLEGRLVPAAVDRGKPESAKYRRLPEGNRRAVVLFCHGAADSDESPMAGLFWDAGFRVFQFDYRGFGESDPAPLANRGLADDAVAALKYLRSRPDIDPDKIVIYGHSLGAGYAMAAGAAAMDEGNPVRAVVVASGFSSWRRIANHQAPVIGAFFGGVSGPDPADYAGRLGRTPLLVVHAVDDEDVPVENAYRLFKAASDVGVPATLYVRPEGGHLLMLGGDELQQPIINFVDYYLDHREWSRGQRESFRRWMSGKSPRP